MRAVDLITIWTHLKRILDSHPKIGNDSLHTGALGIFFPKVIPSREK
jgi:hypothetical protein